MKVSSLFRPRGFATVTAIGFVAFVGIQFIRPEIGNTTATADLNLPPPVERIFRTSCFNCHSGETRLAWFDRVAPANWLVVSHVKAGRSHWNVSEASGQTSAQQKAAIFEAVNTIQFGTMPPRSYRLMHPEAKVSPAQMEVLKSYLESLEPRQASDAQAVTAADGHYSAWIGGKALPPKIPPAPNGIELPADYRNWRVISSSDRRDNNTMRVVLGNDVAMNAIKAGRINPWPDGAIFAKVLWEQLVDAQGMVKPGQFRQVDFMIKNARKYTDTKGWGWARWLGPGLKPFGDNRNFTTNCTGCHAPMRDSDFVFTNPLGSHP